MNLVPPPPARLSLPGGIQLPDRTLTDAEAKHWLSEIHMKCSDDLYERLEGIEDGPEGTLLASLAARFDRRHGIDAPDEVLDLLELAIGVVDLIRGARRDR